MSYSTNHIDTKSHNSSRDCPSFYLNVHHATKSHFFSDLLSPLSLYISISISLFSPFSMHAVDLMVNLTLTAIFFCNIEILFRRREDVRKQGTILNMLSNDVFISRIIRAYIIGFAIVLIDENANKTT